MHRAQSRVFSECKQSLGMIFSMPASDRTAPVADRPGSATETFTQSRGRVHPHKEVLFILHRSRVKLRLANARMWVH